MKPTKNNVYCRDCGKTKMLFESEKKAMNFIKFNGEEIKEENGKSPVRAYYCPLCCGWHVTSRATISENYHSRNERLVNNYVETKRRLRQLREEAREAKQKAKKESKTILQATEELNIRKWYDGVNQVLNVLQSKFDSGYYDNASEVFKFISDRMETYKDVDYLSGQRNNILARASQLKSKVEKSISLYGLDIDMPAIVAELRRKLHDAEILFDYGMRDEAKKEVEECVKTLEHYQYCVLMPTDRHALLYSARLFCKQLEMQTERAA